MPHLKITEATLKTIKPSKDSQTVYWDTEDAGFGVVVGASNPPTISFIVNYRHEGKLRRKVVGKRGDVSPTWGNAALNASIARRQAAALLGKAKVGVDPAPAPRMSAEGPTVREALKLHLTKMENGERRSGKVCSPRSIATLRGFVELHLAAWLDQPLVLLTADALDDMRTKIERTTKRKAGSNPINPAGRASSNRLLAAVSAIWRSYHKRYGLPVSNPVERLGLRALAPRDTRIGNDELPAWYAKLHAKKPDGSDLMNPIRRDLQLFSLFTSVRADGVRNLKWTDVDFDEELILITRAKGDKPYTLPMTGTLREILERRQADNAASPYFAPFGGDNGFVFPSISRDGENVIAVAEPKERHFKLDAKGKRVLDKDGEMIRESYLPGTHANRREYNSVAMEIGIPQEARETLLNHEGRGVNVKHYGRPQNWDYVRSCAEQIEAALWSRIRGEGKAKSKTKGKRGKLRLMK